MQYFVPLGYVIVRQDIRGRYGSEGTWRPLRDDGPDGADLLAWIAAQPWSNGKVGKLVRAIVAVIGAPAAPWAMLWEAALRLKAMAGAAVTVRVTGWVTSDTPDPLARTVRL